MVVFWYNKKNMNKLSQDGNSYYITHKSEWSSSIQFSETDIKDIFGFAYNMSFGGQGKHRNHRSGGQENRKNGQIFINTFQGKLAELAIFKSLQELGIKTKAPNLEAWPLGKWDIVDFDINEKKIAVKSTKFYGNLMLLETKDWDKNANYKPNLDKASSKYDIFVLVRIKPDGESILRKNGMLYSNKVGRANLEELILSESWASDIPGFVTLEDVLYAIKHDFIIPQNALLNGKTGMDAENFYIQSGDMKNFGGIKEYI